MNRKIKFRGQTRRKGECLVNMAGDKCDSNWVYGGIFPQNEDDKGFAIIYQQEPEIEKYPVYVDTVGQYTGMLDKNENEIYEGDIVKCYADTDDFGNDLYFFYKVIWHETYHCWWLSDIYTTEDEYLHQYNSNNIKVIGNVFDNPELLEVSNDRE